MQGQNDLCNKFLVNFSKKKKEQKKICKYFVGVNWRQPRLCCESSKHLVASRNSLKFSGLGEKRETKFKRNAWENAKLLQLINPKISLIQKFVLFFLEFLLLFRCFFSETCNYVPYFSSFSSFSPATERAIFQSTWAKQRESNSNRKFNSSEFTTVLSAAKRESPQPTVVFDVSDYWRALRPSRSINNSTPPFTFPSIPQHAWTTSAASEGIDDKSTPNLRFLPKVC